MKRLDSAKGPAFFAQEIKIADEALAQIEKMNYDAEMKEDGMDVVFFTTIIYNKNVIKST